MEIIYNNIQAIDDGCVPKNTNGEKIYKLLH